MEEEIKIKARYDPYRPNTCKLTADRPIYPQGSAYFTGKDQAKGSRLAEKFFEAGAVRTIQISGDTVTVTKTDFEDWQPMAKKLGEILRAHLKSGEPAVSPDFKPEVFQDAEIRTRIQELIDAKINPALQGHGGFVRLADVKDRKIYLELGGGCQGCAMAQATLRGGVEAMILEHIPQIEEIVDVTDHASGSKPYRSL